MKKSFLVLLLAVLLPSLLLGFLALRNVQEQQIVLERRTAELYQQQTDKVATSARSLISEQRHAFAETLRQLLAEENATVLASHFTARLRTRWNQPAIGFALDEAGHFLSPTLQDAAAAPKIRQFLQENSAFLGGKATAPVYPVILEELNRPELTQRSRANGTSQTYGKKAFDNANNYPSKAAPKEALPPKNGPFDNVLPSQQRNVVPQQQNAPAESQVYGANAEFREFTAEGNEGVVNRFVQDRLNMIFWVRPFTARQLVFGCLLRAEDLQGLWPGLFDATLRGAGDDGQAADFVLALLDDKGQPVAISPADGRTYEWKKPFVASEIGEALPHWEAALYLRNPEQLQASARRQQRSLYLLIGCALVAIALGGGVVFRDTRRQLVLAQQKTDFVSNVSHELKTPLTSIRMFAEILHGGRTAPERQPEYLRIMLVEAERLTRLINNVLDFSRLDRRERRLQKRALDLHEVLERFWPGCEFHLHEAGFTARWESAPPPYPIVGDEDALTQVLVNLLANAEKYGGDRKEVILRSHLEDRFLCLGVLDRGIGVPGGEEGKIFEPFYRAHDSLASGISGTGLGLALAKRIVHEHGGEIFCQPRPGGGSHFTVRLPLARLDP